MEMTKTHLEPEPEPGPSPRAPATDERVPKLNIGSMIPDTSLKIIRWLGQGGMGVVFEVRHLDIERRFAAKLLNIAKNPVRTRRFRDEARTIGQIGSPWIVEIFDFKELADGRLMYLMELVEGPSLDVLLRDHGPTPLPRLLAIARQVCKGLSDAHDRGFVHRDVKPDNIMLGVDADGREQVKLVDFGLAVLLEGPKDSNTGGTPAYMSPEQCRGDDADVRTDIYSLGVTMYELACGQLPFRSQDVQAVRASHIDDQPQPPSQRIEGGLPPGLDQVILRCLAKQPRDRYASAVELEAALIELQLELRLRTTSDDLPVPQLDDTRRQRRLEEGLMQLRGTEQQAERRRVIVGVVLLFVIGVAAALGLKSQADSRDEAIASSQRELAVLSERAREAAAHARWFYPTAKEPEAETAFRVLLELEGLDVPGVEAAAQVLRDEFSGTLVALGDTYWDRDGGRQFAKEFYVQALMFAPDHPRANGRVDLSPYMLLELRDQASRGAFPASQLAIVDLLGSLSQADPDARTDMLSAVRKRAVLPPQTVADIDLLIADLGGEAAGEPEQNEPVDPSGARGPLVGASEATQPEPGVTPEPAVAASDTAADTLEAKPAVAAGRAAYDAGRDAEATRLFHQALSRDSHNVDALVGLHRIDFDRGDYRSALGFARRAVQIRPKRADLHVFVGDSCMKVLDYSCARDHYGTAVTLGDRGAKDRLRMLDARVGDKP